MIADRSRGPLERVLALGLGNGRVYATLLAALVALAVAQALRTAINSDPAWFLYVAQQWLAGGRLYVDYLDPNPPLVVFLSVPPALLSGVAGLSGVAWFKLLVVAAAAASAISASRLAERALADKIEARYLGLVFMLLLLGLSQSDFGQREHLMLIAVLPYLCAAASRSLGADARPGTRVAIGAIAGLGVALKPHFLPLLLLVEGYVVLRSRDRSPWRAPEVWAAGAVIGLYGLVVVAGLPAYLRLVHDVFGPGYLRFHSLPLLDILTSGRMLFFGIVAVLWLGLRRDGPLTRLGDVFLLALIAFVISLLVQHKGFSYHFYPAVCAAIVLLNLLLLRAIRRVAARGGAFRFVAPATLLYFVAFTVLATVSLAQLARQGDDIDKARTKELVRLARKRAPGGSVLVLSTRMQEAFPLVNYAGLSLANRMPHLWPVSVALDSPSASGRRLEAFALNVVATDFVSRRPDLLLVDTSPVAVPGRGPVDVDLLRFFERDPRFRGGMRDYVAVAEIGSTRVYQRRGGGS